MTNEVEKLILEKFNDYRYITFKEQVSYLIYEEIWNIIIKMLKNDPDSVKVSFRIKKIGDEFCIMDCTDIKYSIKKENLNNSPYDCDEVSNILIIKSMFDLKVLYKLLESDKFKYNVSIFKEFFILNVIIDRTQINKIINEIYLKNNKIKKLSKEV